MCARRQARIWAVANRPALLSVTMGMKKRVARGAIFSHLIGPDNADRREVSLNFDFISVTKETVRPLSV